MLEQLLKGIAELKITGKTRNDYSTTKTEVNEIRSTEDKLREATGWECRVDRTSIQGLCQFDDVFVDERRRHTEDEERQHLKDESPISDSRKAGKTKVMTSELTSDIEQWTDQRKVFEEREDTSTYTLCRQREVSVEEKQKQLDQRGPTCEVATSAIETPTDLKKLLEERAPPQQEEPPAPHQQQRQRKSLEEDYPISSVLKTNPILAERTQLNSIEQEGTKRELSEENEEPIEENPVEEATNLNQEKRTKNEMSNDGATEAVNPKNYATTALASNNEDDFDFVLKPINQYQLVVTTSTASQARSCGTEAQYTKFGEDDTTLQHAGWWSQGILGRQGIG
jgi:hypothetical protein